MALTTTCRKLEQIASRTLASSNLATSWTYLPNANDRRLASIGTSGLVPGQSTSFAFTTDAANEITGTTQTSEAPIASPASASSQSATYNNLNQLTNLSGQAFTFDADGNLTADGTRTYAWDAENRLVAIGYVGQPTKATAFAYDGLGRRIQTTSTPARGSAVVTDYLWCGERLCQARNSANAVIRGYYAEGEIKVGTPSVSDYYAPDQLGSVRRVFTSTTAPSYDYDAYGQALQTAPALTNYGFAGMILNTDSGLYLTTRRAYDPATGRFLTRDPIGEAADPEANLYAYVGGDPVNLTDPEGLCARKPQNKRPKCLTPAQTKAAQNVFKGGAATSIVGGVFLTAAAGAEIAGGGPEDPLGNAVAMTSGRFGANLVRTGAATGGGAAAFLFAHGQYQEALNAALETGIDLADKAVVPEYAQPSVDSIIDRGLSEMENATGLLRDNCAP